MRKETPIDRAAVRAQLEVLAGRQLTVDRLRQWFTPLLTTIRKTATTDETLVFSIAFLFEDESLDESKHMRNASRLVHALQDVESNAVLLERLPIITDQDRLCQIVDRFRDGKISRTGYLSAISNSRYSRRVKHWLANVDAIALAEFCAALTLCDYTAATSRMELG
jgi:hypothetical protein